MIDLHLALIHHPVVNKKGEQITAAVTNLDLHDISRAARTYGVRTLFVVTPLEDQTNLIAQICRHWVSGYGARANPARKEALELVRVAADFDAVLSAIRSENGGGAVRTVVTTARPHLGTVGFSALRGMLGSGESHVICFGTAWGLDAGFMARADHVLKPITGGTDYNHLSVRSAASIILDRLIGKPCND